MTTSILALALALSTIGFDGSKAEANQNRAIDSDYVKIESAFKGGEESNIILRRRDGAEFCLAPSAKSEKDGSSKTEDKIVLDLVAYPAE